MQPPQAPNQPQFLRDFNNGINIALLVICSVSTTVQLFSRIPGSTGRWFYHFYLLGGLVLQAFYVQINTQAHGADWVSLEANAGLTLCWFTLHCWLQNHWRSKRMERHSHDPGFGVLACLYPKLQPSHTALISDLTTAAAFGLLLHIASSPNLGNWFFLAVIPSTILCHCWSAARNRYQKQRHIDATEEASHYTSTIQPRN